MGLTTSGFNQTAKNEIVPHDINKVVEHQYLQFKQDSKKSRLDKLKDVTSRTTTMKMTRPILSTSFKVHPLEAMNIDLYKERPISRQASVISQPPTYSQMLERANEQLPEYESQLLLKNHIPFNQRRNPILGIEYTLPVD